MKKRIYSFIFAFNGIVYALKTQWNMRIHLFAVFCVLFVGFYVQLAKWEWCVVLLCCGLVVSLELVNTTIEILCDKLHPEHNKLIGAVKDVSAAAVLVASVFAMVVGTIVFVPHFL